LDVFVRESVGEAGTERAGELAEQQAAVDMSMVSTGELCVMITIRYIAIEFVLNRFHREDYIDCDLVLFIVTAQSRSWSAFQSYGTCLL